MILCIFRKANKDKIDNRFPAYVLLYTNFSHTGRDTLKREVKVSSSSVQILQMKDGLIKKKVKKGWAMVLKAVL